jgi:hypothetical protein
VRVTSCEYFILLGTIIHYFIVNTFDHFFFISEGNYFSDVLSFWIDTASLGDYVQLSVVKTEQPYILQIEYSIPLGKVSFEVLDYQSKFSEEDSEIYHAPLYAMHAEYCPNCQLIYFAFHKFDDNKQVTYYRCFLDKSLFTVEINENTKKIQNIFYLPENENVDADILFNLYENQPDNDSSNEYECAEIETIDNN